MRITKRQLRRIIKEEKTRLLREQPSGWDNFSPENEAAAEATFEDEQDLKRPLTHMSGRNQNVMSQLHTAIDALIGALGNEEAHQELLGIVEEWDTETY